MDGWRKDKARWVPREVKCKTCCKDITTAGNLFNPCKQLILGYLGNLNKENVLELSPEDP